MNLRSVSFLRSGIGEQRDVPVMLIGDGPELFEGSVLDLADSLLGDSQNLSHLTQ